VALERWVKDTAHEIRLELQDIYEWEDTREARKLL
jgi:hypothetical protein